jgi:hypothetical protein
MKKLSPSTTLRRCARPRCVSMCRVLQRRSLHMRCAYARAHPHVSLVPTVPSQRAEAVGFRNDDSGVWQHDQLKLERPIFLVSQGGLHLPREHGGLDQLHLGMYVRGVYTLMAYMDWPLGVSLRRPHRLLPS